MKSIEWIDGKIRFIDQTLLPGKIKFIESVDLKTLTEAIKKLRIRGAPLIGIAAAMGIAQEAFRLNNDENLANAVKKIHETGEKIKATRPTAVNLFWAVDRMYRVVKKSHSLSALKKNTINEAQKILNEDVMMCRKIGEFGAGLVKKGFRILTHCNAGGLATGGYGTAVGVIKSAFKKYRDISVYVDETRPLLQGARLTAWELKEEGIPYKIISDSMAGYAMSLGMIDMVVVGADRIVANGDTANKIGTYSLSVLAKENNVPFYVAAPYSTIDISIKSGKYIPIEERDPEEICCVRNTRIAPDGSKTFNPAFDVTSGKYITAIITEKGIIYPPYREKLSKAYKK